MIAHIAHQDVVFPPTENMRGNPTSIVGKSNTIDFDCGIVHLMLFAVNSPDWGYESREMDGAEEI